jgi:glycosyltransferase involved in cell wall biosynthesis
VSPTVSILMPVYNARDTLAEAVESIRAQTFAAWELIVFDDGSTDGSAAMASGFAAKDRRVRVVTSPRVGLVRALQEASRLAGTEFIARMDADDVAHPDRLALQLERIRANPKTGLCGARVETVGAKVALGRRRYESWINAALTHDDLVRDLFVECPLPHPTFLMRRKALEAVGGYRECPWAEDYDLCMRLFLDGWRFDKTPEVLLQWRESPGRLSRTDPRYSPEAFRALKRHYLFRSCLRDRSFHQWGAGEVGKEWLREWEGCRPEAVVDINPRKIGRRIHGFPIIAPEELPPPSATFTVVAVGAPGARDEIRAWMRDHGYTELLDYLFVA